MLLANSPGGVPSELGALSGGPGPGQQGGRSDSPRQRYDPAAAMR